MQQNKTDIKARGLRVGAVPWYRTSYPIRDSDSLVYCRASMYRNLESCYVTTRFPKPLNP